MKKIINKIFQYTHQLGFFQGVALTLCLTSLVGIAATNLPGFFVFSPGTPISSSEINANFEKLAGTVVVKASMSVPFTGINADFVTPPECPTCRVFRKRINFNSISVGSAVFLTTTDNDATSNSENTLFHYYQVPSDGWYEIRFISSLSTAINTATCDLAGCNVNASSSLSLQFANDIASASLNTNASLGWMGVSRDQRDSNSDSSFDQYSSFPGMPPEVRKIYLKSGQILFVKFDGNLNEQNVTSSVTVGATDIELTIIKL